MINILVWDKDTEFLERLALRMKRCSAYAGKDLAITLSDTQSKAIELLSDRDFDMAFINYTCDNDDENQVAQYIIHNKPDVAIVFTFSVGTPLEGCHKYIPLAIVSKERMKVDFIDTFSAYLSASDARGRAFLLVKRGIMRSLPYARIQWFESEAHKIIIHMLGDECVSFTGKLDDLLLRLPKGMFVRCHQSYIVNISHIRRVDSSHNLIILYSGVMIPVSRTAKKGVLAEIKKKRQF